MLLKDHNQILGRLHRILSEFVNHFDGQIPDDFFTPSVSLLGKLTLLCHLTYVTDADRDSALTLIGDMFGRHGWTSTQTNSSYERPRLDWTKEVMGIEIVIYGAKLLPRQPDKIPVMPTEFPVLLKDREDQNAQPPAQNS